MTTPRQMGYPSTVPELARAIITHLAAIKHWQEVQDEANAKGWYKQVSPAERERVELANRYMTATRFDVAMYSGMNAILFLDQLAAAELGVAVDVAAYKALGPGRRRQWQTGTPR